MKVDSYFLPFSTGVLKIRPCSFQDKSPARESPKSRESVLSQAPGRWSGIWAATWWKRWISSRWVAFHFANLQFQYVFNTNVGGFYKSLVCFNHRQNQWIYQLPTHLWDRGDSEQFGFGPEDLGDTNTKSQADMGIPGVRHISTWHGFGWFWIVRTYNWGFELQANSHLCENAYWGDSSSRHGPRLDQHAGIWVHHSDSSLQRAWEMAWDSYYIFACTLRIQYGKELWCPQHFCDSGFASQWTVCLIRQFALLLTYARPLWHRLGVGPSRDWLLSFHILSLKPADRQLWGTAVTTVQIQTRCTDCWTCKVVLSKSMDNWGFDRLFSVIAALSIALQLGVYIGHSHAAHCLARRIAETSVWRALKMKERAMISATWTNHNLFNNVEPGLEIRSMANSQIEV